VKDTPRQGTPWLDALKNMDAGAISEAENGLDVASSSEDEFSESSNQQGDKSAKRGMRDFWHFRHPVTLRIWKVVFPGKSAEQRVMRQKRDPG